MENHGVGSSILPLGTKKRFKTFRSGALLCIDTLYLAQIYGL
jgi:hypothetical protein